MCHCRSYSKITGRLSKEFCALRLMVSIILAKSICCWQHFRLWNGLSPWGGKNLSFFFLPSFSCFSKSLFMSIKRSRRMSGFAFFLSFLFFVFFFDFKYLLHSRGGEKMAEQTACKRGAQKKRRMDELPSGYGLQATPN